MAKAELLKRAETAETRLRARLARLPDAEDAPTDRLCDAIRAEALNGRSVAGRLRNQMLNVQKPKKSLDLKPLEAWRDLLVNATTHFEQELEVFEALPEVEQRRRYTEMSAVRFALKVLSNGPNTDQGESPLANEWLIRGGTSTGMGTAHAVLWSRRTTDGHPSNSRRGETPRGRPRRTDPCGGSG